VESLTGYSLNTSENAKADDNAKTSTGMTHKNSDGTSDNIHSLVCAINQLDSTSINTYSEIQNKPLPTSCTETPTATPTTTLKATATACYQLPSSPNDTPHTLPFVPKTFTIWGRRFGNKANSRGKSRFWGKSILIDFSSIKFCTVHERIHIDEYIHTCICKSVFLCCIYLYLFVVYAWL
jgi:hypothetical protein